MLPIRARVNVGAMAMKVCSIFPKVPTSLEPHHQIVQCHIQDTRCGAVPCAEKHSMYYTVPADRAICVGIIKQILLNYGQNKFSRFEKRKRSYDYCETLEGLKIYGPDNNDIEGLLYTLDLRDWNLTMSYSLVSYRRRLTSIYFITIWFIVLEMTKA